MQSQRPAIAHPIEFSSVATIDALMQISLIRVVEKVDLPNDCYQYKLRRGITLEQFNCYFPVDVTGETFFEPDFQSAILEGNVGALPTSYLLTTDKSYVKALDYRNHLNKLVYNEILAEMLLSARFRKVSDKIDVNMPNQLIDLIRPACNASGELTIFPCGSRKSNVFEKMRHYREPTNYPAQDLIALYFQHYLNDMTILSREMRINPAANHSLNRENVAEIEDMKRALLDKLITFKEQLEQDKMLFNASIQSYQNAIKKHPAQAFSPVETVTRKRATSKENMKLFTIFTGLSTFAGPYFFPICLYRAIVEKFNKDQYEAIARFRKLGEDNGGLLPTNADKNEPRSLATIQRATKNRNDRSYVLDVNKLIRSGEVIQHINKRLSDLTLCISTLTRSIVVVQVQTTPPVARNPHGFHAPALSSSSSSSSSNAPTDAIVPRYPQ